ncbi:MAG TPA: YdeI/OmpD-associated family protein [Bacteroidia bacterium]|jgi:uncharacterized protein YdeI (YjbR/CyaY-like superfamily)|nr:YdeI/OmpD-associated family protein [Bacteroidia bacterium]
MKPNIDAYFSNTAKWQHELEALRMLILDCNLVEEFKWSIPVYTFRGKNIVGINRLKESVVLAFFKGALLSDEEGILIQPGKVQAARWVKFTSVKEIIKLEPVLKAYIFEAIEIEKAGLKIIKKKTSDYPIPQEFQDRLDELPALKKAFYALTPGRQRAYIIYFSQAKQSKTREARVEKYLQQIINGKGITY